MWNASFKLTLSGCVIYIGCVGFASLDIVCDEHNDCAWNVCLLQLSNECMYVNSVENLAHIELYSDCSRRGANWLIPFAMVLFSVV